MTLLTATLTNPYTRAGIERIIGEQHMRKSYKIGDRVSFKFWGETKRGVITAFDWGGNPGIVEIKTDSDIANGETSHLVRLSHIKRGGVA